MRTYISFRPIWLNRTILTGCSVWFILNRYRSDIFWTGTGLAYFEPAPVWYILNRYQSGIFWTGTGLVYFEPVPVWYILNWYQTDIFWTGTGLVYFDIFYPRVCVWCTFCRDVETRRQTWTLCLMTTVTRCLPRRQWQTHHLKLLPIPLPCTRPRVHRHQSHTAATGPRPLMTSASRLRR